MKLTTNTTTLQTMVAKSMKGASCNKMIPLTSLMAIQLKDHTLTLITTDATNYLYITEDKIDGDNFYVVVQAEMFSKLIARLTCEKVSLELKDNFLCVKGNGNYSIELPLNEEGELIKYPDPLAPTEKDLIELDDINLSTIRLILNTAKSSLAETNEVPCYTGYYVGNSVVATDTYKICGIDIPLLDTPALIGPETMDLLDLLTDEKVNVLRKNNTMVFKTHGCTVYSKTMDGIEDFQIDVISDLINQEFDSSCKVNKDALVQLLDRLSLFVSAYDKNGVYLTFTREGLQIDSKQANSSEIIPYSESNNFKDFTCCIDIEMLRSQVKANTSAVVNIQYGQDNAIKLTDGNVTQIVALLEDERVA
jgi:DNA polymerase III sliding clamp (beta) subunit (PCNA family)